MITRLRSVVWFHFQNLRLIMVNMITRLHPKVEGRFHGLI